MPGTNNFKHLSLPLVLSGKPKLHGGGPTSDQTRLNRRNRVTHGNSIRRSSNELSRFWTQRRAVRLTQNLPQINTGIPILLEIDPATDIEYLRGLGFEIVTEVDEGFILVASEDVNLEELNNKTIDFIENRTTRCNSPAKIYALCEDNERLKRVLSSELNDSWNEINDNSYYYIDIGVSCSGGVKLPDKPTKTNDETEEHYLAKEARWQQRCIDAYIQWDELKSKREEEIENFISEYNGEIVTYIDGTNSITSLPDSFTAKLYVNGICLKDLALNFAYVFEIALSTDVSVTSTSDSTTHFEENITLVSPPIDAPKICVIDSGIQEGHRYLAPAILHRDSLCLLNNEEDCADYVRNGGHGTRVAGAILYPKYIPTEGAYSLPCWIRNIKVLDENGGLPEDLLPSKLIEDIVYRYFKNNEQSSKIYNHSIGSNHPYKLSRHMSAWAATIDNESYENDILFIQAAGNISTDVIRAFIMAGYDYPTYFTRDLSRLCSPAESIQALTVGSVSIQDYETEDTIAIGQKDYPSSFSRSGPGIWDTIKPDVVEYGGTDVRNKTGEEILLTTPEEVCPQLIRKSPQGPAFSQDEVGTSFSTPKVTNVAAEIQRILPNAPALLYRALIVQSACWPTWVLNTEPTKYAEILRKMGYGIPDRIRATENNEYRITLITDQVLELGEGEAHVFRIPIPQELRAIGDDYDIKIEVTLSYAAKPRRTRRTIKRYLSTWLDWICSRLDEDCETFYRRVFETGSVIDDNGNLEWVIGDAINRGQADNFSRKSGTIQKDWAIVKSNQLSDAFCIAVRGHKGWGSAFKARYAMAVSFEAINKDIEIYEPIRAMIEVEIETQQIQMEIRDI